MIPITYRLNAAAEKKYICKALAAMGFVDDKDDKNKKNNNDKIAGYSKKLEDLLQEMQQFGYSVAEKICKNAKRFKRKYPNFWYLCGWLVMPYEDIEEVKNYLYGIIKKDMDRINHQIKNNKKPEIKSYHDLLNRSNKYFDDIYRSLKKSTSYDKIYNDFSEFNEFYKSWSKNNINRWITKQTGLKVCPYCNISYTYNRKDKVTAQLDHFFPKSEYPIFALCFYNLIPSCPACNKLKLDDTTVMASPYKNGVFKDLRITWKYKSTNAQDKGGLTELEKMIKIDIKGAAKDEKKNLTTMKIKEAYQQHNDYASEIIKKAKIYTNPEAQKLICAMVENGEIKPEEVQRFYLGNYTDPEDLKKRPLAKMTSDLYKEIVSAKK